MVTTFGAHAYLTEWGRQLRIQRKTIGGISQEMLAEVLGVDRSIVSRWEAGKLEPSTDNKIRIAAYFGVNPNVLFAMPIVPFTKDPA